MASLVCRKCGAEERNTRNECVPCKRERRKSQYARSVGRAPEPAIKRAAGPLWRFDEVDACTDAAKRQTLMAAIWDDYMCAFFFNDEKGFDEAHIDEMHATSDAEQLAYRAASDAAHLARQKAARHHRR